ncbi:DUF3710 domain-containing protein [Rhodococcus chondri]|uniref:DUF3710 domain-containing protein n=1 Tax=Rhodococcus chondri TaxID=3065941 RepID=A0ABU7JQX4_9NOCA|nr:DUF3710 domain-containing protein [Rhodococcus sp. CC-R104]MEE2032417.1 DUF3710 domain-containing protein [Rhodococcus sp. CC-R104]
MFGRRRKNRGTDGEGAGVQDEFGAHARDAAFDPEDEYAARDGGPYDIDEIAEEDLGTSRLDLGSVLVPVPAGGQIQVEMTPAGNPQAVHLVTQHGRITVSAYAAPKSPGQWREVAAELAETLRNDNATVSMETGPWGRELHGATPNADLRFIGVDGYRWMIRCVVAGPVGAAGGDSPLVAAAHSVLADTVVRRGTEPHPVRTPLPVVLPQALAQQLAAAQQQQQQQLAAQQAAQQGGRPVQPGEQAAARQPAPQPAPQPQPQPAPQPPRPRRGESGSAMQQLGF